MAAWIRRSPSIGLRVNRDTSYTHTPSEAPDSSRAIISSQSSRTTRGFHADSELSLNGSPTRAPRRSITSMPISI
jgi:hypothetical protein